jgi:hypothetical protein
VESFTDNMWLETVVPEPAGVGSWAFWHSACPAGGRGSAIDLVAQRRGSFAAAWIFSCYVAAHV